MGANSPSLSRYPNPEAMAAAVAAEVVGRLSAEVAARGAASLVCAGGTTPGDLYEAMSHLAAPWASVWVTASDERWAAPDSEASNERLVRSRLLIDRAAAATYVPLRTNDPEPEMAEAAVGAALASMPRPFTVTLLGMGADGHTASLFPGAEGLKAALDLSDPAPARTIRAVAAAGSTVRMTLTARALLDSRVIILLIKGADKLAAYEDAMAGDDVLAAPVRAVLKQHLVPVAVCWSP